VLTSLKDPPRNLSGFHIAPKFGEFSGRGAILLLNPPVWMNTGNRKRDAETLGRVAKLQLTLLRPLQKSLGTFEDQPWPWEYARHPTRILFYAFIHEYEQVANSKKTIWQIPSAASGITLSFVHFNRTWEVCGQVGNIHITARVTLNCNVTNEVSIWNPVRIKYSKTLSSSFIYSHFVTNFHQAHNQGPTKLTSDFCSHMLANKFGSTFPEGHRPTGRSQIPGYIYHKIMPYLLTGKVRRFKDCSYEGGTGNGSGNSNVYDPKNSLMPDLEFIIEDITMFDLHSTIERGVTRFHVTFGHLGKDYGFIGCARFEDGAKFHIPFLRPFELELWIGLGTLVAVLMGLGGKTRCFNTA